MSIPMEVFEDILSRLPVKPLLRFRCVTPQWRDLIDSPNFVKLHLARSIEAESHLNVILCSEPRPHAARFEPSIRSLETTELHHHPLRDERESVIQVWGSCNGIICLTNESNTIALWNPSTREFMKLPKCRFRELNGSIHQGIIYYSFGYDEARDDYKVLSILTVVEKTSGCVAKYHVKVYSVKSSCWREVENFYTFPYMEKRPGILARGAWHWTMGETSDLVDIIAAFDITSEELRNVPIPRLGQVDCVLGLESFRDSICLGVNHTAGYADFWVMKEYGVESSWKKLFSLAPMFTRPVYFPKSSGEVFMQHKQGLIWFDTENSKPWCELEHNTELKYMTNIEIRGVNNFRRVAVYVESIVRLSGFRKAPSVFLSASISPANKIHRQSPCSGSREATAQVATVSIPMEVFEDILSRLPVKPLLKFRCVSPQWRDLIGSKRFVKLHLARSIEAESHLNVILCSEPRPHAAKFEPSICSLETTELNHYPLRDEHESQIQLWGSCNGLVCLSNESNTIALWNPSTREFIKLPTCRFREFIDTSIHLARNKYGFGYDEAGDDYKVLNILTVEEKSSGYVVKYRVKVYSVKSNSWREVDNFYKMPYIEKCPGVLACGALHWVMGKASDMVGIIAAFDLTSEEWRTVPIPHLRELNCSLGLEGFRDSICLSVNHTAGYIDYWVMKEYGVESSWKKLFSLVPRTTRPIYFPKSSGEVFMQHQQGLIWFDAENTKPWLEEEHITKQKYIKDIEVRGMNNFRRVAVYMESLVRLNGFRKLKDKKKPKEKRGNELKPNLWTKSFPTEVLEDILSRLPVEPLLRLRCVSPLWRDLIDSPHFVKLHLSRSIQGETNLKVIFKDLKSKPGLHAAKFKPSILALKPKELDHHPLRDDKSGIHQVWGSCNGLLCLGNVSNTNIVLWNPSTRRSVTLPFAEFEHICNYHCTAGYGFGYDGVGDDYKVVRVMDAADNDGRVRVYDVKVYSLKSNSWHTVEKFYQLPYIKRDCGQLAHNSLHWVMGMERDEVNVIVAFDLHSETCRIVPGPKFQDIKCELSLERYQESICVVYLHRFGFIDIWVMREYGVVESWAKLFSLRPQFTRPVYFSKNNTEVFMQHDGELLWCDTENDNPWYDLEDDTSGCMKKIEILRLKWFQRVEIYTASLVPLGRISKMNEERKPKANKRKNDMAGFLSRGFKLKL